MKRVLITAGATREYIDPIRYISNQSQGTLGYLISEYLQSIEYDVTLIGCSFKYKTSSRIKLIKVETVKELQKELEVRIKKADILIMSAAVSDFTVEEKENKKIKRKDTLKIQLKRTPDLLQEISREEIKGNKYYIGFCLETENLIDNAKKKLKKKRLDCIVATQYLEEKKPFGDNKFSPVVIFRDNKIIEYKDITKREFGRKIGEIIKR